MAAKKKSRVSTKGRLKSEDANEKVRRQIEALERVARQLQEERAAEAHKRALGF